MHIVSWPLPLVFKMSWSLLFYSKWQASPWHSYMNFCTGEELPEAANISVYQEFLNLEANLSYQNLHPIFMVSGKRLWVGPLGTSLLIIEMSIGYAYPLIMCESWYYVPFLLEPRWPLCHSAPLQSIWGAWTLWSQVYLGLDPLDWLHHFLETWPSASFFKSLSLSFLSYKKAAIFVWIRYNMYKAPTHYRHLHQ